MKSVWAIEEGQYSDYHVVGVFSSEENAKFYQASIKDGSCATISEWFLDPSMDELRKGLQVYGVIMYKDGDTESVALKDPHWVCEPYIWNRGAWAAPINGRNDPTVLRTYVWAKSPEHAIKITNEHRTRFIAEGKWK